MLWSALQSRLSFFTPYTPAAFLTDFLLNCGAILFATTLYSSAPILLNIFLLSPAVVLYFRPPTRPHHKKAKPPASRNAQGASEGAGGSTDADTSSRKGFVTTYRGCMIIVTCLAILAVDFRVFPRRFAKVENWGTSLMDLGVGSFVFSAGLVGARPILRERASGHSTGLGARLYASVRHAVPLLVLGLVRLYSVKGLDYAEHVSEYGVHWNFFFTMALLPPFVALFHSLFAVVPSYALLSLLLGVAYQVVLDSTSLKAYILVAPRTDLLSKNREGVFSFIGYLAIFLAGQATGMYVLPRADFQPALPAPSAESGTRLSRTWSSLVAFYRGHALPLNLLAWSATWTALFVAVNEPVNGASVPVSRRLANLPYVLWVSAFNVTQLLAFYLVELLFFGRSAPDASRAAEKERHDRSVSRVLAAFNRNGLAMFLLANLLTGAVNLTIPTLEVGSLAAMGILLGYGLVLTAVALTLDVYGLDIKM